jgi:hypothetical protein
MLSLWTSVLSLAPATDTAMLRAEAWTRPTGLKKVGGILLPPLPDSGKQIVVSQDAGVFGGTGGRVWPAASALVRWQLRNPNLVQGSSVLELGAGCGACGLFAAGMGASNVMLTDANRHCCELMTDSASANGLGAVKVQRLEFEQLDKIPNGPFDLIIGSDITYRLVSQAALSEMIRVLLQSPAAGSESARSPRCVLSCENRRTPDVMPKDGEDWYANDFATQKFVEGAALHGLCVSPLVVEPPGEATANSVSIFEVKLA